MRFRLAVVSGLLLSACTYNSQFTPAASASGVRMLFEYPPGTYKVLGVYNYDFYRPGFRQPTLADVWPELSQKVSAAGGNACVVRDQNVPELTGRFIKVTCEVLTI